MLPFQSLLLRAYMRETGWNEDSLYSHLVRSSSAILDFPIPSSIHFSLARRPYPGFHNSFEATALPALIGSLAYISTSSRDLLQGLASDNVRLKDAVDGFRVWDMPAQPKPFDEVWQAGVRVDEAPYLIYGRGHFPSCRVDGLYTTRLSPSLQAIFAFVHVPPFLPPPSPSPSAPSPPPQQAPIKYKGNALLSLQHSVGRYSTESSYSFEDGLFGFRGLYSFAPSSSATSEDSEGEGRSRKRVDEEEALGLGLRGRFSLGGEVYLSPKERSAGMSVAGRFCTIPDAPASPAYGPSPLPQPPMTLSTVISPLVGHISTSYTSSLSSNLAVSSRFDLNVFSFESDWTIGGEWWIQKTREAEKDDVAGVLKMRCSTNGDLSMLYVSRFSKVLCSIGVVGDMRSPVTPVRGMGLELQFFS